MPLIASGGGLAVLATRAATRATPSRDGRRQHLTLTCATAATMRGSEGPWRPGLHRLNIPFLVWEMRICEPLGGRRRSQVAGQLKRTRPLTVR